MAARTSRPLDQVQRWFQAVVTHPGGVEEGMISEPAQVLMPLSRDELEQIILPSSRLSAKRRLSIYAHAYYARLIECLGESFPVVRRTLGAALFDQFAFEYLQRYPSRSYRLDRLGEHFARFLEETRPSNDEISATQPAWPEVLADLARLEWEIARVFDGEGVEGQPLADFVHLRDIAPEDFAALHLPPVVCLRLLELRFPVNDFYTASRRALAEHDEREIPLPEPVDEWLALSRRDWVVRRHPLSGTQFLLLASLQAGSTVGEAITVAVERGDLELSELTGALRDWFEDWSAQGLFAAALSTS